MMGEKGFHHIIYNEDDIGYEQSDVMLEISSERKLSDKEKIKLFLKWSEDNYQENQKGNRINFDKAAKEVINFCSDCF